MKRAAILLITAMILITNLSGMAVTNFETKVNIEGLEWGLDEPTVISILEKRGWDSFSSNDRILNVSSVFYGQPAFGWLGQDVRLFPFVHNRYGLYQVNYILDFDKDLEKPEKDKLFYKVVLGLVNTYGLYEELINSDPSDYEDDVENKWTNLALWQIGDGSIVKVEIFNRYIFIYFTCPDYELIDEIIRLEFKAK